MNEGGAQDVKERALKVTWKEVGDRPTDSELLSAFSPVGRVVRVQIKDKCAAVLFASAESVAAAVAAAQDGPWKGWRVQPMTGTRQKPKENGRRLIAGGRSRSWAASSGRPEVSATSILMMSTTTERKGASESGIAEQQEVDQREEGERIVNQADVCYATRSLMEDDAENKEPGSPGPSPTEHPISEAKRTASPLHQLQRESNVLLSGKSQSVPPVLSSSHSGDVELLRSKGRDCRHRRRNNQQRLKTISSRWGSLTEDALRKQQQQYLPGFSKGTERIETRNSCPKDVHGGDDSGVCRQEWSPFTLPEELRAWTPCTQTGEQSGLHLRTKAEEKTGQNGGGSAHGDGGDISPGACTKIVGGPASSFGSDAVPPRSTSDVPHLATDRRGNGQQQYQERSFPRASLDGNKAGGTDRELVKKGDMTTHDGDELQGRGDEAEGPDKPQAKQAKQAKRLALEVATLRSSLRATTSELNAERSTRSRLEDEWWKKTREWEEERSSLVTSTQIAERASKLAQEEVGRSLAKEEAREVEITSKRITREAAQNKTEGALKGVVNVQDRLLRALQNELEMTNRAREAAQNDSREAKEQLHAYVQDFLLWRDRAKRLEARVVGATRAAHPKRHAEAPPSCDPLSTPLQQQADDTQRTIEAKEEGGFIDHGSSAQARKPEVSSDLSIPEKYARYFETTTGGCASPAPSTDPFRLRGGDTPEGEPEAAAAAAAAWSTRSAMAGALSSPSSRAYFQRSMEAQQEISLRLERDLVRARADLQAIYVGSRTRSCDESSGERAAWLASLPKEAGCSSVDSVRNEAQGSRRNEKNRDDDSRDQKENCQILECVDPDAGDAPHQPVLDAAASTGVARNPYMGRVLAALLGGDLAASPRTTASGLPGASIHALRLSDYPPALQAVFGEWPAAVPLPPGPAAAAKRRVTGAEALPHDRSRVTNRSPSWRAAPRMDENEGREQEGLVGVDNNGSPPAENAAALVGGEKSSSSADANVAGESLGVRGARGSEHRDADLATAVEGVRGSCSVSGAFRGYEAKSPLLQRWLGERFSSSPRSRIAAIK